MASPQPGQPPYGSPAPEQYPQEQYDASQHDAPAAQQPAQHAPAPPPSGASRKKRGYAGQAYEFGGGANSALGGQQQGGGAYPPPPGAGYGGYGQQPAPGAPQPSYGAPVSPVGAPAGGAAPGYGQQPAALGGYQPPEPSYPAQGAPGQPPPQPGVGNITQGMGTMALSGQGQHQQQGRMHMNQLYPTDLLNSPLNVADLDLPPPPIILPANVNLQNLLSCGLHANFNRLL